MADNEKWNTGVKRVGWMSALVRKIRCVFRGHIDAIRFVDRNGTQRIACYRCGRVQ